MPALRVEAAGYAATYVHKRHLTLFPGGAKQLGDIVLNVGRAYVGRITDQTGQPIAGARVKCGAHRYELGNTVDTIGSEMPIVTDSNGEFQTPHLPLGVPFAYVQAEGYLTGMYDRSQFARSGADGRLADLRLKPDKPIHGLVKDELGRPIKDAEVRPRGVWR